MMVVASPAHSAFPGGNGRIAFHSDRTDNYFDIYTMNADGTAQTDVSNNPGQSDFLPAWSPDGHKIAFEKHIADGFVHNYVMNADGTAQTDITTTSDTDDFGPVWSPDGTRIAFGSSCHFDICPEQVDVMNPDGTGRTVVVGGPANNSVAAWSPDGQKPLINSDRDGNLEVYAVNVDGTGLTRLTNNPASDLAGDWSPDGSKIVFESNRDGNEELYTMNADGSGQARLTNNAAIDGAPAWSPDGRKIVFDSNRDDPNPTTCGSNCNFDIYTMSADGTGSAARLTNDPHKDSFPDWQPIPINTYPRPKGATPLRVPLVPANKQCTAPNSTHGAPLSFGSCGPPQLTSGQLTTGTPDSNGLPARMDASLGLQAIPGNSATTANEADVKIDAHLNDVFKKDLSDYGGALRASLPLRITDKDNTPAPGGPGAGTTQPFQYGFDIPCTPDPATNIGSDCSISTTADTLVPGTIKESLRTIWQIGRVRVDDAGPDGNPDTTTDNTVFAVQGMFVP
jgi:dipeptidyl aminopeptidase/acylaminoacyl peptidase